MKKLSIISSTLVALLAGCDGQTSQNSNNYMPSGNNSVKVAPFGANNTYGTEYALNGVNNSWPPMKGSNTGIADNILAQNYYLIVDGSGSMKDVSCSNDRPKMEVAKSALSQFVNKIPSDANVGVFAFDNRGISERQPLKTNNIKAVNQSIQDIKIGNSTPLSTAISQGYIALTEQAKKQLGYGEYHLVVVTDGAADDNEKLSMKVNKVLGESPITIHTIGFCIDKNHSLNVEGKTLYKAANNPEDLAKGLESVLAEAQDFNLDSFGG
jgi:Ca-activated chloride channel family protein